MRSTTLVGLLFSLAGCGNLVTGSGRPLEEARPVGAFTAVEVDDSIAAEVTVGPAFSVVLRTDDNVAPLVTTAVEGGTLVARLPPDTSVSSELGVRLVITLPELRGVTASGASTVDVGGVGVAPRALAASGRSVVRVVGLASPALSVDASGASRVSASGTAPSLTVAASGASTIALDGVAAEQATLDVSGPSDVVVRASGAVRGQASGGSHIHLRGAASARGLDLSGGSTVDYGP